MKHLLLILALLGISLSLTYCDKDDQVPEKPSLLGIEKGLIILNEGNFMRGNASVDLLNLETDEIQHGVFERANEVAPGDVAHSGRQIDSLFYLVLNNSGKIAVVSLRNFSLVRTIEGFNSPRYIEPISPTLAYVSDLYANHLYLVDLIFGKVIDSIPIKGMTERMVMMDQKVFVANNDNNHVFVIDPKKHRVVDSIFVGGNSNEVYALGQDLMVLRNAGPFNTNRGAVISIDPTSNTVLKISEFQTDEKMWYSRASVDASTFYFSIGNEIYTYKDPGISKLFAVDGLALHNFVVFEGMLWLSDAKDYQQLGEVIQFDQNGKELSRYKSGIIPSQAIPINF